MTIAANLDISRKGIARHGKNKTTQCQHSKKQIKDEYRRKRNKGRKYDTEKKNSLNFCQT